VLSIISELLFVIEYTNTHGGDLPIVLINSCSSKGVYDGFEDPRNQG